VLPKLLGNAPACEGKLQNRNPAQRRHGTLRLAQNQPLIRQQGADLAQD
jgi:hypothetical protein